MGKNGRIHRDILENLHDAVYVCDSHLNLIYMNSAAEQLSGWDREEALTKKCYEVFGGGKQHCQKQCRVEKIFSGECDGFRFNRNIRRRDGRTACYDVTVSAISEQDKITAAVFRLQENLLHPTADLSQHQDYSLTDTFLLYRTLFERSPYAVIITDPRTKKIVEFNQQACTQLGYTREEFAQFTINDIEAKETPRETEEHIRRVLSNREGEEFESRLRAKDGSIRDVIVNVKPIQINGQIFLHNIVQDITQRRETELKLEEMYRELKLLDEINQATLQGESIQKIVARITRAFGELCHSQSLTVYFYDKEQHRLIPQNISIDESKVRQIIQLTGVHSLDFAPILKKGYRFAEALESGNILITSDPDEIAKLYGEFTENPHLKKFIKPVLKILDVKTVGAIPIKTHQGPLALITFNTAKELRERDLLRIKRFGEQLASTLVRIRAEEKLHKLSRAIEHISSSILITDKEGKIEYVNPGFTRITGYSTADVIGKTPMLLKSGKTPDAVYQNLWETIISGKEWRGELLNKKKNGEFYWASISISPVLNEDGDITHFIGVEEDITEHKRMVEALKASEEKYRTLFEESKDVVYFSTPEGKIIDINPAGLHLLGYSSKEEISQIDIATDLYVNPSDRDHFQRVMREQGHIIDHEVELQRKDGGRVTVLITATATRNNEGEVIAYHGIMRDITEKKRLQMQLLQAQKMEAIGTLAGGIAHDFNNILAAILGYSELARMDVSPKSRVYKNLDEIYKAGLRATELVQQILTFSRQNEEERKPIQLHPIIKEALKLLRASLPTTIDIRYRIPSNCGTVLANPTQIHQVIMNLCTNAYHAMREHGGILEVTLQPVEVDEKMSRTSPNLRPGPYLTISVKDTGHGMDKATLERIFEPFFTTKPPEEGTGMGLAVVHGIIMSHEGHITVKSAPGKGTTFTVYLPVVQQKEAEHKAHQNVVAGGKEHILFVDDEENIVRVGKQILEYFGYTVTAVTGSTDALEIFHYQPDQFDLVITDQTMPGMTGVQLAEILLQLRPDIPIILTSGYSELVNPVTLQEKGIKKFVMKPLTAVQLAGAVREVLDGNG